jgi:hypothetical protein
MSQQHKESHNSNAHLKLKKEARTTDSMKRSQQRININYFKCTPGRIKENNFECVEKASFIKRNVEAPNVA